MHSSVDGSGLPDRHCQIGKWRPKKYSRYRIRNTFADMTLQLRRELAGKERLARAGKGGDKL